MEKEEGGRSPKMSINARPEEQLPWRPGQQNMLPLLNAIVAGYAYDPGDSDLDNEQPINVRMTLGDYRLAWFLKHELESK